MVGTSTDDSNADSVLLIPAGITIDDIDSSSSVQVVNCTFAVDLPNLSTHHEVSYCPKIPSQIEIGIKFKR